MSDFALVECLVSLNLCAVCAYLCIKFLWNYNMIFSIHLIVLWFMVVVFRCCFCLFDGCFFGCQ